MNSVMRRRCKALALAAGMLLSAVSGLIIDKDRVLAEASGDCGGDAYYNLDDDGVLTISGTGGIDDSAFFGKGMTIKKVIIQEGIEWIGKWSFYGINSIEEVEIPSSCKDIQVEAFCQCSGLKKLSLANGVKNIYDRAFSGCTSLEELSIPASVEVIGDKAFENCSSMNKLNMVKGIETIGASAFGNCSRLKEIVIPDTVGYLDADQFEYCTGLEKVTISSETTVYPEAFRSFSDGSIDTLYYDGSASQASWTGNWTSVFKNIEYSKFDVIYHYMDRDDEYRNRVETIVDKGGYATEETSPKEAWTDHVFTGEWYTDKNCSSESLYDFATPVTGDLELYAKWIEQDLAVVEGYRLLLTGEVGVEFFISIPESLLADENASVVISNTVPGKTATKQEYTVAGAQTETVGKTTCYKFIYTVPAATMTCPISVTLKSGDEETLLGDSFTVQAYAEYIHAHPEISGYEEADPLVVALLNYGAYSQKYFGIDTENLANVNVTDNVADADPGEYTGVPVNFMPDDPPITYYGSSLNLQSKVSALVYFKVKKGVDYKKYTIQLMGRTVTPVENSTPGFISINIDDINPAELTAKTNCFVIRISGGSDYNYDYSPLYFMQAACASDSVGPDMKNLAKALYLYGEAAKAYLG